MPDSTAPDRPRRRSLFALLGHLARLFTGRAHEVEVQGRTTADTPNPVPRELAWDDIPLQLPSDGVGPIFHRRYRVDIAGASHDAEGLMGLVKRDVAAFSPPELANFKKSRGVPGEMAVGDKYDITILGPWNGSVRVSDVGPTSFTLVTLEGHPEAGQIRFEMLPHPERQDDLRFQIQSWARSRDMLVSLSYNEVGVGKEVQKNVWITFCERVVEASGGRQVGEIDLLTEERKFEGEVMPLG